MKTPTNKYKPRPSKISPGEYNAYIDGVISNTMQTLLDNKPVIAFNQLRLLREFMKKNI
jgi:hypothetical protein